MMWTKQPKFGSGTSIVMEIRLCMAKGVTQIQNRGVYGGSLIKKSQYWTNDVPGDEIDEHFKGSEVGHAEMI